MSIDISLKDSATGRGVSVNDDGQLYVMPAICPPDLPPKCFPYREHMTLNGDGVTTSMVIDGSSIPQEFMIKSINSEPYDNIYISSIIFTLADVNMSNWNEFGDEAALGTGCSFKWCSHSRTTTFHSAIKTNYDLAHTCLWGGMNWYQATMRGLMKNALGAAEGIVPILRFSDLGYSWGLCLPANSEDKLVFTVNDDLSVAGKPDNFEAVAYGVRVVY